MKNETDGIFSTEKGSVAESSTDALFLGIGGILDDIMSSEK